MKKLVSLFLIALLCIGGALPTFAEEAFAVESVTSAEDIAPAWESLPEGYFATANDMFHYWGVYGYPDYVCGVWTETGSMDQLTVAVTDDLAGKEGKLEIMRLLADDGSVTFVYRKYSRKDLNGIFKALHDYMGSEEGIVSLGIRESENCVEVGFYADMAENEETQRIVAEITELYGERIHIEWMEGRISLSVATVEDVVEMGSEIIHREENGLSNLWITLLVTIGILGTAALIGIHRSHRAAAQTTVGTVTAAPAGGKITRRQVETMVKNSESEPPPELEDKILTKLDREI